MHPDFLPGTNQPVPALMTAPEAVRYLRLDILTKPDGSEHRREIADAVKSLDHLIRKGRIAYVRVGKNRRFPRAKLDRFIHESTVCEASE